MGGCGPCALFARSMLRLASLRSARAQAHPALLNLCANPVPAALSDASPIASRGLLHSSHKLGLALLRARPGEERLKNLSMDEEEDAAFAFAFACACRGVRPRDMGPDMGGNPDPDPGPERVGSGLGRAAHERFSWVGAPSWVELTLALALELPPDRRKTLPDAREGPLELVRAGEDLRAGGAQTCGTGGAPSTCA